MTASKKRPPRVKAGTSKAAAEARKRRFVDAYIANNENGTEAALSAGYAKAGAAVQASRMLRDPKVQQLLKDRRATLVRTYELNTAMVMRSLVQELTFDPARLYDRAGQLKPIHELDEDTRMALTSLEVEQAGGDGSALITTKKVKWAPRQGAREQAMKHLGLFERDNTQRTLLGEVPRETLKAIAARLAGG